MAEVSIILITYKMKIMLDRLLYSIKEQTSGISYEIIVIDNHSEDGTLEMLRNNHPEVILIANKENKGVAGARNQGFEIAQGKYVVTLDSDMLLTENALKHLFEFMEDHQDAGLAGCKLVFEDGSIQPSGRRYPTVLALLMRRLDFIPAIRNSEALRKHEMADWDRKDTRKVDYVIGACQFIRREAKDEIGVLDDSIFYGPEDLDYCLRMYRAGWNVYYVADTSIIHFEQRITRKKVFSKLTLKHLQGIVYIFWKYKGKLQRKSS